MRVFAIKGRVKSFFRPSWYFLSAFFGFVYDFYRFARYAGYFGCVRDNVKRDYKAVKIYHRLEKSLSFRGRSSSSGSRAATDLMDLLGSAGRDADRGFQECVAINVLNKFVSQSSLDFSGREIPRVCDDVDPALGGVKTISSQALVAGKLPDPESFFFSRFSVRDFSPRHVDQDTIRRAVSLARRTPSVCNRQAWYVYHVDDRSIMNLVLSLQNGNTGFGQEIPSLLILAADQKAFDTAGERYQHWIDGGMFSMSLVYALHSLGVASCCLNWSKTPSDDLRLRKVVPIRSHHSILMMLAVGYPNDQIKVCCSERRPLDSVYEYWG